MTEKGANPVWKAGAFLCFCTACGMAFPLSVSMLPRDEHEASLMLRSGELDSLDWDRLKPFYVQPLHVPSGGLRYLKELAEVSVDDLPVSPSRLKPYEPWADADVERFFKDFPHLALFRPILSFEAYQAGHRCNAGLNVHAERDLRPTALSRFSMSAGPRFSMTGSAYHKDSTLSWRSRAIDFRLPGIARFELGNFDAAPDGGLFFGYFPDDNSVGTTASNWRYSQSRAWNGAMATTDCSDRLGFSALYHERPTENVQEIACNADVGRFRDVMLGVSRLAQTQGNGAPDSSGYYVHAGVACRLAGFDMTANSGVDAARPLAVPFSVRINRRSGNGFVTMLAARIPGSLGLPLSRIAYLCRRNFIGQTNGTAFPDMTLLECRTVLKGPSAHAGMETAADLITVVYGHDADMQAGLSAHARFPLDIRVEYGCRATTAGPQTTHTVDVSLKRALYESCAALLTCKCFFRDNGFRSVFVRMPLDIVVRPEMTVSPFITFFSNSSRDRAASIGLKQTTHWFDKTWCEWSGQVSRDERRVLDWEVNIRTNFLF